MPRTLALAALLGGCAPTLAPQRADTWDAWSPHTATDAQLRVAASVPGLATLHRGLATVCPQLDVERDFEGCEVAWVDEHELTPTGTRGLMSALRFDETHIATLSDRLELAIDDLDGHRTVVARGALDPRAVDDGRRLLYVQLAGEPEQAQLGDIGHIEVLDVITGEARRVTDDPRDSSPWMVPHTDDVLFVSARTGIASIWLAPGDGSPPHQITNIGMTEVGPGFVPVPGRELVWVKPRTAVFTAHYGTHSLWTLDLDTGAAKRVGPGRLPALHPDGGVVAVHDEDPALGLTVVRYEGGAL